MASSPGFGSCIRHQIALLRLAFTMASLPQELNQATYSTLVGSFFNRNAVTDLRPLQLLVGVWFQILFHRPLGLLLSFPSRYLFTFGQEEYLALAHRRACFQRGFSSLIVLWIRDRRIDVVSSTGLSPSLVPFSKGFDYYSIHLRALRGSRMSRPATLYGRRPTPSPFSAAKLASYSVERFIPHSFGCSRFARRYSGNITDKSATFFSFPLGTEMFHFPRFPRNVL